VGTGFHPELTGRENIYLNGAILGMSRAEIDRKFDEIVAFAEVEKFLDTPVKRYSSGMYVRLAFAVAAHLEPEILIVDEVLAVGDAEFQKRCLGKMKEVACGGRTILFVSHNTAAIQTFCSSCILLDHGKIDSLGKTNIVVDRYLTQMQMKLGVIHTDMEYLRLLSVNGEYNLLEDNACSITVKIEFLSSISVPDIYIDFGLENERGVRLLQVMPNMRGDPPVQISADSKFFYRVQWASTELAPGEYFCTAYAHSKSLGVLLHQSNIKLFRVIPREANKECMAANFTSVLMPKYTNMVIKESV
jgi:lipopolysaccharide transport system ATP-binding protein